jgi:Transglycosylase SLT domain
MANIYDPNATLIQPNVVGNFQQGQQTAQQNALAASKQQAIDQAQQDQQTVRAAAPGILQGDPTAFASAAAVDPAAATQLQSTGDAQFKRLQGAINYIDQQQTPQAKEAAYQQTKPFFTQPGQPPPPDTYAQAQPIFDQVKAHIAQVQGNGAAAPVKVGAGESLVDPTTGKPIYTNTPVTKPEIYTDPVSGKVYQVTTGANAGASQIPITGGAQGAAPTPGGVLANLPAETQAYVPKVKALLNGAPAFDQTGQPTNELLNSIRMVESGGNNNALSSAGAQGAYQLMPATAASVGVSNPLDPTQARAGASQYLAQIYKQVGNDPDAAIAAYNAGPGAVQKAQQAAAPGTGFLTGQPKNFTQLSPADVAAAGLPVGTVAQRGPDGKVDIVSKPADNANVVAPGDPTKTGADYLATLPPSMGKLVQAIANGDAAAPSASSRSPEAQALLQAVYAYDPTASASNLPTRTATRKSFTSGKDAQNMTALSQLALHLDHLNDQVGQTSGIGLPIVGSTVNNAINSVVNSSQDPTTGGVTAFNNTSNAVAHELRAVFANAGGGTQAELEENLKQLNPNASTAQKQAAIQNIAQLVHGRFGILQDKYSQGLGKTEDPFSTSYPGAESTILKLAGVGTAGGGSAPPENAPAQGSWSIQKVTP